MATASPGAVRSNAPDAPTAMRSTAKPRAGMGLPFKYVENAHTQNSDVISQGHVQTEGGTRSKAEVLPTEGKGWRGN